MRRWLRANSRESLRMAGRSAGTAPRVLADGGREGAEDEADDESADADGLDRANVEVTDAGESEPADPKWEKPDVDDIPEVSGPKTRPADPAESGSSESVTPDAATPGEQGPDDPTAGMPNTARSPDSSRVEREGTDGYVVALELCARLPDEARLPEEAADLVPVALEAELEQDIKTFASHEFDNPSPHVQTLEFVERDEEVWLQLRLGVPHDAFTDLDPEAIEDHALQQLDGLL